MFQTSRVGTLAMDAIVQGTAPQAYRGLDEELNSVLVAVRSKSRDAFEILYALTSGRLFEIVSAVKSDRLEAEAVLQEVFVNVWHEARYFDENQDDAAQWLLALARRTALNCMRYRARSGKASGRRASPQFYEEPGMDLPEPLNIVVRSSGLRQSSPGSGDC